MSQRENTQGSVALTQPQAYYEFFNRSYHRNRIIGIGIGLALLLATCIAGFASPVRNLAVILWGEEFLQLVWPLVLLAGTCLLIGLVAVTPDYHNITLFPNGISLAGKAGKTQIPFSNIFAAMEYEKNGRRWTNLYLYGEQRPIRWSNRELRDYSRCVVLMEKLRADYLLGREFPDNFSRLELLLAEKLNLTGGELFYNGEKIEPVRFRACAFEQITAGVPDIVLLKKEGGSIALLPERIGNRTALLRVLEYYIQSQK